MATLIELVAEIVSAHASTTEMSTEQLLQEIQKVEAVLKALEAGKEAAEAEGAETRPAVTLKEAFKKNEVICMVCGKSGMKTLARHLKQAHGMEPREYKKQFGIPSKQPLAAKNFSEERRRMAQERGLADILAKAREKKAAIKAEEAAPKKAGKARAPRAKAAPQGTE